MPLRIDEQARTLSWEAAIPGARILIVDDEWTNVDLLVRVLSRANYRCLEWTTESSHALRYFHASRPDLVLLDLHMPRPDGFEVLEALSAEIGPDEFLPILVLTGDLSPQARTEALARGAKDFLLKPFDIAETLLRIRNLLETRRLYLELQAQKEALEHKVRERTRALEEAQLEVIERLARAAEARDDVTGHHTRRVGEASARIARALGLDETQVELIRRAAPLHDVGKISLSDTILLNRGRLTPEQMRRMELHTVLGAEILAGGQFPLLRLAEEIALTHHERWDGSGYPRGLRGEEIPLSGRIVAVADVFDALTHERPYKPAWPLDRALAELEDQRGRQFDPRVVDALVRLVRSPEGLHGVLPQPVAAGIIGGSPVAAARGE